MWIIEIIQEADPAHPEDRMRWAVGVAWHAEVVARLHEIVQRHGLGHDGEGNVERPDDATMRACARGLHAAIGVDEEDMFRALRFCDPWGIRFEAKKAPLLKGE